MNNVIQLTTATSGTVTANDTQQDMVLVHDASVTATLTVAFPATPINGQIFCLSSVGGIIALTMSSASSIIGSLTGIPAAGNGTYMFANSKWVRIK